MSSYKAGGHLPATQPRVNGRVNGGINDHE